MDVLQTRNRLKWSACAAMALFATASLHSIAQAPTTNIIPDLECVVLPSVIVDVASPVPGVLSDVQVDRGHVVMKGQLIAALDSGVEKAELALADARANIISEIRLNEVNLSYDNRTRDRLHSLQEGEAASKQERDRAKRNADLSKWRVKQAKDINALRTLELARSQEVLQRKSIRSPIDGVVTRKYRSAGEYVKEQPIVQVVQLNPLIVEAAVPMEYFGRLNNDSEAAIRLHSDTSKSYRTKVQVVDQMGDPASNTFGVQLSLDNSELAIPAGSKCNLSFVVQ
ncbi:MAG: efflux RND transporter periplasmic adaptor subunit [Pseudomonadales bacterium]